MVVVLQFVLIRVEQDRSAWIADRNAERSEREGPAIRFEPSPEHGQIVELEIMLQWPAFVASAIFGPSPIKRSSDPGPPTALSWLASTIIVAAYWFLIAWWIDKRPSLKG